MNIAGDVAAAGRGGGDAGRVEAAGRVAGAAALLPFIDGPLPHQPRRVSEINRIVLNIAVAVQGLKVEEVRDGRIRRDPTADPGTVVPGPVVDEIGFVIEGLAGVLVGEVLGAGVGADGTEGQVGLSLREEEGIL